MHFETRGATGFSAACLFFLLSRSNGSRNWYPIVWQDSLFRGSALNVNPRRQDGMSPLGQPNALRRSPRVPSLNCRKIFDPTMGGPHIRTFIEYSFHLSILTSMAPESTALTTEVRTESPYQLDRAQVSPVPVLLGKYLMSK